MRNGGRIDRKMGDKLDWSSWTHMNEIISQLRKFKWRNEWMNEWMNEGVMMNERTNGWVTDRLMDETTLSGPMM